MTKEFAMLGQTKNQFDSVKEFKNGDVFSWKFKNDEEYRKKLAGAGTAYWALDQQCVYIDGKFWDTYKGRWDGTTFSGDKRLLNIEDIDLEFKCNLNNVREISKFEIEDYDIVYDCSYHKNLNKLYFVDVDAKPSKKALISKYERKIARLESDIKVLQYDLEQVRKDLLELQDGV